MSFVSFKELAANPCQTAKPNKSLLSETHGSGDNITDLQPSPCNSQESLSEICGVSSYASCASFKTICVAWKNRVKSASTISLDRCTNYDTKIENFGEENSNKPSKRVSLCVVFESHALNFTESSEEESQMLPSTLCKRFLEPHEIREAYTAFKQYDENNTNSIELPELKLALEKLSVPQTHLAAKELMTEIVGPHASKVNFCQFLLTYAAALQNNNTNADLARNKQLELCTSAESIDVSAVGVSGAKLFFEHKISKQSDRNSEPSKDDKSPIVSSQKI